MAAAAADVKPWPAWAQPVPDVGKVAAQARPASCRPPGSTEPGDHVNRIGQHLMDTCNGTIPVAVQAALEQITEALDAAPSAARPGPHGRARSVRVARTSTPHYGSGSDPGKGHRMGYFSNSEEFEPDDGAYAVQIIDASAFAGQDGREWAKVVLQVVDGEHEGKQFDHFMNLNNPFGLQISQEALVGYGLDVEEVENFGDLAGAMPALIGTRRGRDRHATRARFRNTHVVRTLTGRVGRHEAVGSAVVRAGREYQRQATTTRSRSSGHEPGCRVRRTRPRRLPHPPHPTRRQLRLRRTLPTTRQAPRHAALAEHDREPERREVHLEPETPRTRHRPRLRPPLRRASSSTSTPATAATKPSPSSSARTSRSRSPGSRKPGPAAGICTSNTPPIVGL